MNLTTISRWYLTILILMFSGIYSHQSDGKILRGYTQNITIKALKYAYAAVQDQQGYLWFANRSGLHRFDGHQLHSYTQLSYNPKSNDGLSSSHVRALYIDSKQTLWVGTNKGLNRYSLINQTLTHVTDPNKPQLNNINISAMHMDNQGFLWISTRSHELVRFNTQNNTFEQVTFEIEHLDDEIKDFTDIKQDANGDLWLASRNGLYQLTFDANQKLLNSQRHTKDNSDLLSNFIIRLTIDKHQNIWIGTNQGLSYYHLASKTISSVNQVADLNKGIDNDLVNVNISTFALDQQNNLWVGTWGKGVHIIDANQQDIINHNQGFTSQAALNYNSFVYQNAANDDIQSNEIFYLLADNNGMMWIVTAGNIKTLKTATLKVNHFKYIPSFDRQHTKAPIALKQHEFSQPNLFIRDIYQDSKGYLWFASYKGLSRYHPIHQTVQYFYHQPDNPNSLPSNHSIVVFEDHQQNIWIGTQLGLVRFNPQTLDFTRIKPRTVEKQPQQHTYIDNIFNYGIQTITQDSQNQIWVSNDNQLLKLNAQTGLFTPFNLIAAKQRPNPQQKITAVQYDQQHTFWIGSNQIGLGKFDLSNNSYSVLTPQDNAPNYLINDILIEQSDKIWLATDGGLTLFDGKNHFQHFHDNASAIVAYQSIEIDAQNNLWIGTDSGLKSFNTGTESFNHFGKTHGIQNTQEFIRQASFQANDGSLYFAGSRGIDHFKPQDMTTDDQQLSVILTDFLLANRPIAVKQINQAAQASRAQPFTLDKAIDYVEQLTLTYHHNVFDFKFGTFNFINPEQTRYSYRLKGFDKNWLTTDNDTPIATFTNIPAGQYQFEVRATINAQNHWSNSKTLTINIQPPWWQTTLAYYLYALFIVVVLYVGYRWRTASIIARSDKLEQQVNERTETISKLMAQKDRMFANISHEFRTPLTLIFTPAQRLLASKPPSTQEINKSATTIIRNSERLLRMVEQLIEYAKSESNSDKIGQQYYSLKQTLDYLITCFDSTFSGKKQQVTVQPFNDVMLLLKPDALEIMLTNLLSNAVKYTPENGKIEIKVTKQHKRVCIAIKDNGIGIAEKDQDTIFERFGRAAPLYKEPQPTGTGIGLALVKEIVEANHGQITLTSQLAQGSCFTITLPIATAKPTAQPSTLCQPSNTSKQITALEISTLASSLSSTQTASAELSTSASQSTTPQQSAQQSSQQNKPQILIIDDNQELLGLINDILTPHFDCQLTNNPEQGITLAEQQLPDLVISDLMMPGISGLEVLSHLKSNNLTSHIPVILLTAKGDTESRIEGWKNSADEYLSKPFNDQELIIRINNILAMRKMISARFQQQFIQNREPIQNSDQLDIVANKFSQQLEAVLENHYHEENLTIKTIAEQMALSTRQLTRKTKSLLNLTPTECLRTFRLKKAAQLLDQGQSPSTITYEVGFGSHSYFTACFKAQFGCTPTNYRKK